MINLSLYPGCVFHLDSESVMRDGGTDLVDRAGGLILRNTGDDVMRRINHRTFMAEQVNTASPSFNVIASSGALPVLGDKHAMLVLVAQNMTSLDPYIKLGNPTAGKGIYTHMRIAEPHWVTYDATNYIQTGLFNASSTPVGTPLVAITTFNRDAATEALSVRGYVFEPSGAYQLKEGNSNPGATDIRTSTWTAYTATVDLNVDTPIYSASLFHLDSAAPFAEERIMDAGRYLTKYPGEMYPGWKEIT